MVNHDDADSDAIAGFAQSVVTEFIQVVTPCLGVLARPNATPIAEWARRIQEVFDALIDSI